MRAHILLTLVLALSGCSMNSSREENRQASEQVKPCCCAGTTHCQVDSNGESCCSPDRCTCKQITVR